MKAVVFHGTGCRNGGWVFGHLIHGLQAEYARAPYADTSLYDVFHRAGEPGALKVVLKQ